MMRARAELAREVAALLGRRGRMSWRRTPSWIAFGGASLAAIAGYVNAIGYLGVAHRGVSHVSGQVTQIGIDVAARDGEAALRAATLVVAFVLGAAVSGAVIRTSEVTDVSHERYGSALLIESILLGIGAVMVALDRGAPELFIAAAMGLQNAMATTYSGAIVRTTHVTGIATDLGSLLGQFLRGGTVETGRVKLLALLLSAFLVGGLVGAAGFGILGRFSLVPPLVAISVGAVVWILLARAPTRRDDAE